MSAAIVRFPTERVLREVQPGIPNLHTMVRLLELAARRAPKRFDALDRAIVHRARQIVEREAADDGAPAPNHIEYARYCAHLIDKHLLLLGATPIIEEAPCAS